MFTIKKDILILGKGPAQSLDKSLRYSRSNSYLFVNGVKCMNSKQNILNLLII